MSIPPVTPPQADTKPEADTKPSAEPRPQAEKSVLPTRRQPSSARLASTPRWKSLLPWGAAALALLIGIGIGVLVMRQRHQGQGVVAAVNGVRITDGDLFMRLQTAAGQPVMHKMVEEELQLQFAAKKGVPPTDAEVEAKYQQAAKDPRFLPALKASGMSLSDYKHDLKIKLAQAKVLTQGVSVTEPEIRAFYALQSSPSNPQAQFYKPETASFRVIATPTQPQAAKAMQELNAKTAFDLVAAEFSVDPSKNNGGMITPLQRGRSPLSRTQALESAVFNLSKGQMYGPVNFNKQWWIFRCEDKTPGQAVSYETVQEEAKLGAEILKGTRLKGEDIKREFADFLRTSNLQSFWPQYQHAVTGR